jgi:lysine 2,3-aminomutase
MIVPFDMPGRCRQERQRFRRRHYPGVPVRDWNDWHWQARHRIRSLPDLARLVTLSADERAAVQRRQGTLPLSITPYYASLMDPADPADPLRRCMIPVAAEWQVSTGETVDPLGEDPHSPVPGIVHTYPDKVLFLAVDHCATYCRYCTRSRRVGTTDRAPARARWQAGLAYIRSQPGVRDVLISGGDPLMLADDRLEWLLQELRAIPHVEFVRIGTKMPAVMPQRITPALVRRLKRFQPLFFSIHFTHLTELTPEVATACARLADAGIPLGSQTVLLRGVNDSPAQMKALMQGLLRLRVKPYYLHQCDAVHGSAHFRTPIRAGQEIVRQLHGHTSGYAVPAYMLDAPGGGGKIPLTPPYVQRRQGGWVELVNYQGAPYRYFDGED